MSAHGRQNVIAAALIGWALTSVRAADPAAFRYAQDVAKLESATPKVVAVALADDAWAALSDGAADLRLFDEAGVAIPYLLRRAREFQAHVVPKPVRLRVADLKTLEDNAIEIILDLEAGEPSADRLDIETPLKDFERRVAVDGQTDDGAWERLVENALVYDYARFMDVRQVAIDMPPNRARRLRVTLSDVTDEQRSALTRIARSRDTQGESVEETYRLERRPFRIDRIAAVAFQRTERVQAERLREYRAGGFESSLDETTRDTVVEIAATRPPVNRIMIEVADDNFFRDAVVQVALRRDGRQVWHALASGRMYRVRLGGQARESLTLDVPEQRADRVRVRIRNHDNPPLRIEGIRLTGPVYEAVFVAEPGREVRMHYGADGMRAPVYDTSALLAALGGSAVPIRLETGPRRENPLWVAPQREAWDWLQSRAFFMVAVAAALAVLGVGLARAIKRADSQP